MVEIAPLVAVLAQSVEEGATPLTVLIFYLGIPAFALIAVGAACWIFWRAKQRDDARVRAELSAEQQSKHKELTWRNARSS